MKTTLTTLIALTALTTTTVSFATATPFKAGQRLTADQLNTVATQANVATEALGLGQDGNAVVAATNADLNQAIQAAVAKTAQNCHQATCTSTVYLVPNASYTVNATTLSLPTNVSLVTLGHASATIALGNAALSIGKNVALSHVNFTSNHNASLKQQLKTNQVNLNKVSF